MNIITIAKNTFKETIRDRILYGILAFALLFIVSTVLFGSISLGEDIKVIKDFGLAGIYIFSLIITIFLGTSLIFKELEKRTIYIIFSKPVSKLEFVVGKFFGLWISIVLNVIIMTAIYLAVVGFKGGGFDALALTANLLLVFELAIFVCLAILFSTFTSPLSGTIYSILFLYMGHSLVYIKKYAPKYGNFMESFINAIYYIIPNLDKFNIRNQAVYGLAPSSATILWAIAYAAIYCTILLSLANLSLKKQEF